MEVRSWWRIVSFQSFQPIFPSSKICSCYGQKLGELPLSVREWTCPQCGARHDADVNAAVKLRNYAVSSMVSAWCQPVERKALAVVAR
ncbi:MAG: transposase [Synergistaceae bacterium]|nr:transposase [Synergistaceae bacterium]